MVRYLRNFPNVLGHAGNAGPRRIIILGTAGMLVLIIVVGETLHEQTPATHTTIAKVPKADSLPGGMHSTPDYERLAAAESKNDAQEAASKGGSSMARMPGSAPVDSIPVQAPAPATPEAPKTQSPPVRSLVSQYASTPRPATTPQQQPAPKIDKEEVNTYKTAIGDLLAEWHGKKSSTIVDIEPERKTQEALASSSQSPVQDAAFPNGGETRTSASSLAPSFAGHKRMLIPADCGVYARTITSSSSDHGGPVILEAESGPIGGSMCSRYSAIGNISGLRMTGEFEQRGDRLVVTMKSLTLQDGHSVPIDGLVVAPDSMETAVASSVDHHYAERFVLPVAAAFVAGLGQAIALSGSSFVGNQVTGGYGASYQNFNAGKIIGIGAGAAGAQASQLLTAAAPRGSTVTLGSRVNVGVIFLSPLEVPG